jgi:hypothetical protein
MKKLNCSNKKSIIIFIFSFITIYFLQFNCHAEAVISSASSKNLTNHNKVDFKICDNSGKHCIYEFTVLRDIYKNEKTEIINNIGLMSNKKVVQIIYSAKFYDGKDSYAIFLTQSNEISPTQGIATCRACRSMLGLAIYQYHNKWKIFVSEGNLHEGGSSGQIGIEGNIKIYPNKTESFLITYDQNHMSQGYGGTTTNIIAVNTDIFDSILSSSSVVKAVYQGSITTEESECGAKNDGIYWKGKLEYIKVNAIDSYFKLHKQKNKCNTKKNEGAVTEILRYDNSQKKYISKN